MGFSDVLRKAFPYISAAAPLGGPLATMAAAAVGKALGNPKVAPGEDSISNAIANAFANPEQRAALLKAEQDFQLQMAELGYKDAEEIANIAQKDRDSARNREIQVRDLTPRILAFLVIVACGIGEGWYFTHGAPSNASPELIGRILGTADAAVMLVLSYYFGSSAGSAAKTQIMAQQQKGPGA